MKRITVNAALQSSAVLAVENELAVNRLSFEVVRVVEAAEQKSDFEVAINVIGTELKTTWWVYVRPITLATPDDDARSDTDY